MNDMGDDQSLQGNARPRQIQRGCITDADFYILSRNCNVQH